MYHKNKKNESLKRPARWIARILPTGHFSCGRIPPPREKYHYNPQLFEYEKKYCIERTYYGEGYECTTAKRAYYQRFTDGRVMGTPLPQPGQENDSHLYLKKSSEATPEGLTFLDKDGTQILSGLGEGEDGGSALGLSTVPTSRIRAQQGIKGISNFGRQQIREGCFLLERDYGKKNLGFYTFTLPHQGEALKHICKNWAKLLNRFFEELHRAYLRKGSYLQYVCAVEIQEKRYLQSGEVAPHIHYVANAKHRGKYLFTPRELRAIFERVCRRFWDGGESFEASENCQVVRKDAGRYLSKYLSKGGRVIADIALDDADLLPRRWFKLHESIRRTIRRCTLTIWDEACWDFIRWVQFLSSKEGSDVFIEEVHIKGNEEYELLVGYYGKVPVSSNTC